MTANQTIDGVPRGRDALVVLVETFRDALHRGKQPTFSAGDLKFFITEFCELRALLDSRPVQWLAMEVNGKPWVIKEGPNAEKWRAMGYELFPVEAVAQPKGEGEPFAWYTEDYLTDKSATTYDLSTAERWKHKGWPVNPLYLAPPQKPAMHGMTWKAQGEANDYAVLLDGDWLMQVRVNGQLLTARQEALMTSLFGPAAVKP